MGMSASELLTSAGLPGSLQGPRAAIVVELKRAQPLTAKELGQRIGLSLNATRHHLRELEAERLIGYEREPRGVGAPVFTYRLTESGERLFPRRYEETLREVLEHVVARVGRREAVESLRDHYRQLTQRLSAELAGVPRARRVERVVEVLREEGYMASWDDTAGGGSLTEHNCAMRSVAQQFPEICDAEQRFLSDVLSADVERTTHMLTGCQTCSYHIDFQSRTEPRRTEDRP